MNIAALIARILLGLVFVAAGASGFFLFNHPPPAPPGLAGQFQEVFFKSGWVLFVDGVELVSGALLLANRYVPLALTMLGAIIANILVFHFTIMHAGTPIALALAACWMLVAYRFRASFAPLLAAKA